MNVNYTARQMPLTPEIKQFCEKKLKALKKLLTSVVEVDFVFSVEKNRNKVEMNIKGKGASLMIEEESLEMMNSLNLAFDSLEKKLKKEREKWREKKRRKQREKRPFPVSLETGESEKHIIRSDNYSLKPMPLEEAIIQFDLKKREVFVFRKSGSEKWAVLYRRKDGHYGLVEPE